MLKRSDFPQDFIFGAATSAYQIEGTQFGGAGLTHWDQFAKIPGRVVRGENGARACEHYHRFDTDLDYLKGFDAYRFSTNWARVLPDGRGQPNQQGLDFYDRLVDAVLARGLRPYLTLYHWDLPAALADLGGWTNRDVALWFGDYTDVIMDRIGDRVASVATINEPWCVSYLSHYLGLHAPGETDIGATARAMHHVLLAHGEATTRLRARGQENLGIVLNFEYAQPLDQTPASMDAADRHDALYNRWFIQALTKGSYPDAALQGLAPHLPTGWQDDMAQISQPLDWLGVNYYTRQIISHDPDANWPAIKTSAGELPKTQMGWEIYPEGLSYFLNWIKMNYIADLPVYITENGMASDDSVINGAVNDPLRLDFINRHIRAAHAAMQSGVNLRGYFIWSLLDNYEWAFGFDKRFGLIHVDFDTQIRTPKQSYFALLQAFGHD